MRPAPWSHQQSLKEWLSKYNMPGRYDPETNELLNSAVGSEFRGEELIEIFENEEYGGYGLRAKKRLSATESDVEVARIARPNVLNRKNMELRYGGTPSPYTEIFELWDTPVCCVNPMLSSERLF